MKIKNIKNVINENVYDLTIQKNNNFFANNILVHNCAEILMPTGVCNLGSFNLVKFLKIDEDFKYVFDFDLYKKCVKIGVRFLDNINDISSLPLEDYKNALLQKRRIGNGNLSLGSLMYILGIRYGSEQCLNLVDKIYYEKCKAELIASAELGKEKGNFPLFDKKKYFSTYWWKQLKLSSEDKNIIEKIGYMRNSHRSMNAPTGNCVSKKTKIRTNNGIKSISQIFKDNKVNIKDKNTWNIPIQTIYVETLSGLKRITGLFVNNNRNVYKVKTKNCNISGTNEHKVLIKINDNSAKWIELKDLRVGDKILIKK